MNWYGVRAIYLFEMARWGRTLTQSIVAPVISVSLYFVVFGAAIGSRIAEVDGARITNTIGANILFPEITLAQHKRLQAAGAGYYTMSPFDPDGDDGQIILIRLVPSFRTTEEDVDRFLLALAG